MAITPKSSEETTPADKPAHKPTSGWRRLAWFVGLWAASALGLYLISLLIRWAIVP